MELGGCNIRNIHPFVSSALFYCGFETRVTSVGTLVSRYFHHSMGHPTTRVCTPSTISYLVSLNVTMGMMLGGGSIRLNMCTTR